MRKILLPLLFALAVAPVLAQRTHKPPLHGKDWMAVTGKPLGVIFRRKGAGYFRRNGATERGHPGGSSLRVLGAVGNLAA
jgi:gamma-glutamyltranspeptidase/glutathione hydrolase